MDQRSIDQKIELLMTPAGDDREASPSVMLPPRLRHATDAGALRPLNIRPVRMGTGRRTTLLRILMTNACSYNCHYCPMRRDRDMPRALLKPEDLVRIFLAARVADLHQPRSSVRADAVADRAGKELRPDDGNPR